MIIKGDTQNETLFILSSPLNEKMDAPTEAEVRFLEEQVRRAKFAALSKELQTLNEIAAAAGCSC